MTNGRNFRELALSQFSAGKFISIGLDSDINKVRKIIPGGTDWYDQLFFNRRIIERSCEVAGFYKLNAAFYEPVKGGFEVMKETVEFVNSINPTIVVGVDAKRGDVGNTNNGYVEALFDYCGFDFVTVAPYMGIGSLQPFLDRKDKGVIVVCLTSNPEADEFQGLYTFHLNPADKPNDVTLDDWYKEICNLAKPLYQRVAYNVTHHWNTNNNCGLVVGANRPEKGKAVREIAGDNMIILSPAVGAQTKDQLMEDVIKQALLSIGNSEFSNVIFNNSRAIIFASNDADSFAEVAGQKALEMHNTITSVRSGLLKTKQGV